MRLLLISNSTNAGEAYLNHPKKQIKDFLGSSPVKALFIPYAAVTFPWDAYAEKVQERFSELGHEIDPIHHYRDPVQAVKEAAAIVIGGGNTWQLISIMQDQGLIDPIRNRVLEGIPYIGWSAGANVACPTIRTTNDMPIVEPNSFLATALVPFQINPHYLDANPEGHAGETREARIEEYITVNPDIYVVGLREGTMLLVHDHEIELKGPRPARIFRKNSAPWEVKPGEDMRFLMG